MPPRVTSPTVKPSSVCRPSTVSGDVTRSSSIDSLSRAPPSSSPSGHTTDDEHAQELAELGEVALVHVLAAAVQQCRRCAHTS